MEKKQGGTFIIHIIPFVSLINETCSMHIVPHWEHSFSGTGSLSQRSMEKETCRHLENAFRDESWESTGPYPQCQLPPREIRHY